MNESDTELISDYGKFGKLVYVNIEELFSDSVLLASACFHPSTRIRMKDGSVKEISKMGLGDELFGGGRICMKMEGFSNDLYLLDGVLVTGNHAVYDATESEQWQFVKNIARAEKVSGACTVYSLAVDKHVIVTENQTVFADYTMTDAFPELMNSKLLGNLRKELPKSKLVEFKVP